MVEDSAWRDRGLWAMDICNANSWRTAQTAYLPRSRADILLVPETKIELSDGPQLPGTACTKKSGWVATASSARRLPTGLRSAGCAVAVRLGYGMRPQQDLIDDAHADRLHLAWVAAIVRGGVHAGTIYLRDSDGLSEFNMSVS